MQHYTVQDIMALNPCQPTEYDPDAGYPEGKLQRLFGDRQSVTALDICDDERVPIKDRQWVLHRLLSEQIVHEVACRYVEHALEREEMAWRDPDPRSWAAIAAKRQWLRGEISDGDLDAAESAARAVVEAAGWEAWAGTKSTWPTTWTTTEAAAESAAVAAAEATSRNAASAAASAAAWATAWAASWAIAKRWQLATLRAMIEEMEYRTLNEKENP